MVEVEKTYALTGLEVNLSRTDRGLAMCSISETRHARQSGVVNGQGLQTRIPETRQEGGGRLTISRILIE